MYKTIALYKNVDVVLSAAPYHRWTRGVVDCPKYKKRGAQLKNYRDSFSMCVIRNFTQIATTHNNTYWA